MELTKKDKKDILDLHNSTAKYLNMIKNALEMRNNDIIVKALSSGRNLKHKVKTIRSSHLNRLAAEQTTALMSLVFMDKLNAYRRIKDHALNIAEVIAGEK